MLRFLLALSLFVAPATARAEWFQASSKHFVVYGEGSADQLRERTSQLERIDKAMRVLFAVPDRPVSPLSRVHIYYLNTQGDIERLAGLGKSGVAGFFQGRASGSVAFVPQATSSWQSWDLDANTILIHEYVHYFVASSWPGVVFPMWLSEGLAEFVGTAKFRPSGNLLIGALPMHRAWSLTDGVALPAEQLLKISHEKLDRFQTAALYARGWALTHYLLFDKEGARQLAAYIGAINSGKSAAEAAEVFGSLNALDLRITRYTKRKQLPVLTLEPEKLPIGEVTVKPLSPAMVAIMPAMIRSRRGVDAKSAQEVVLLARQFAAPFPNDPDAQNELAEAEFDAGNYQLSAAAAERALAADPKSIHALLYKGMAEAEIAKKAKVTDHSRWAEIRRPFLAANKLDTEYPEPLIQFYQSFETAGEEPTQNAKNGLVYAYQLAPFDLSLRMTAGRVLLQQDNVKAARIAFEPVAYGAHGSPQADLAKKMIDALDASGPEAALKVYDDAIAEAKKKAEEKKPDDKKE